MIELAINVEPLETRIAVLEKKTLIELNVERHESRSLVGSIYRGRVDSIVPGIQAAFIDIGFEKNGFLYVSDIAGAEGTGDFVFEEGTVKPRKGQRRGKAPSIESMVKKDQYIMVQVSKDMLGTKGVRLTNYITLPGRYCVLMPTVSHMGVSRKIESDKERDRLRKLVKQLQPKGMGVILRTAAEGISKSDLEDDLNYIQKVWQKVLGKMESMKGSGLLHEDLGPVLRTVRDRFSSDVTRVTIDSETEYSRVLNFLDNFSPILKKCVKLYRSRRPLFDKLNIEDQITKALQRTVYLKSGGSICIDHTEALVAIDVNTGRFTGSKALEDTVFKTNLEAAEEIARQVRLRDIGGIIVVDFIDMQYER
ncbi:MAG: Rne/Rng family ribonuclease, partial [Candidatus Hydrogenedentes bacterium]|nr:Rne/Rng family ribonuclease [Candidatus Hydrogenedentota bacterium]